MSSKFEAEKAKVELLVRRLDLSADYPGDPNSEGESGADVVAVISGRRVGIQVTDLDTGEIAGVARAAEAKLAREARSRETTYGTWGQNDPAKIIDAFARSIARKARMSSAGFDDFWLLLCCGVPDFGAVGATMVVTQLISTEQLAAATDAMLNASTYSRVFIHAILGTEPQALYEWQRGRGWVKSIIPLPPSDQAPDLFEALKDPELLADPDGWCDREVTKILAELRKQGDSAA